MLENKHIASNFKNQTIESGSLTHEQYFDKYSEAEVWNKFKSGSEVALVNIYKFYYPSLFKYGSQFTKNRELIQDAIQDLFSEIIKRRNKLSNTSSIKFYLFKSLKTTLVRLLRHEQKFVKKEEEKTGFEFGFSLSQESKIIQSQIEDEKRKKLNNALKQLGVKQREILYYFYFEGLTISEIAELMDFTNAKSAQNLLYKSIKKIKTNLLVISILIFYFHFF